jgi:transcriptional antiterminator RfaH
MSRNESSLYKKGQAALYADGCVLKWFAVYTVPRHEKQVAQHLDVRGVENFLPLYQAFRRWKNGVTASLELPLFPNYLFVRISRIQRPLIQGTRGVLYIVGPHDPNPLPDFEIESLRAGLHFRRAEPHPLLTHGEKVRITGGPFAGLQGVLLRRSDGCRVILTLHQITRSVAVEVNSDEVDLVTRLTPCTFNPKVSVGLAEMNS